MHDCSQEAKILELEKRTFPPSVDVFTFLVEDALFKKESAKAFEKFAKMADENALMVREIQERSDRKDEEARKALDDHARHCPMLGKFRDFYQKEFIPVRDDNIKRSGIREYVKPVLTAALTFVLIEILKRVVTG